MSACSNYLEAELLDHVLGKGARSWTPPANLYVALFTADTGQLEAGTFGNEVPNLYAYARQTVAFDVAASPGGTTQNTAEVAFPQASGGNWGTISHMAIVDNAAYGLGNVLLWGPLTVPKTVNDGDQIKFAIGDIDASLA